MKSPRIIHYTLLKYLSLWLKSIKKLKGPYIKSNQANKFRVVLSSILSFKFKYMGIIQVSPFTNTSKIPFKNIKFIDKKFVNNHLIKIQKTLISGKYDQAEKLIRDTTEILNNKNYVIDMQSFMYDRITCDFYNMTIELANRKNNSLHDRINNLHYYISLYS
jgi:hypothetical protein